MSQELAAAIASIPALAGFTGQPQRLGGLTNRVWRLGDKVLRLPGAGTEAYIDRSHEATAARLAAAAGVSPPVLHADPETGLMVTAPCSRSVFARSLMTSRNTSSRHHC